MHLGAIFAPLPPADAFSGDRDVGKSGTGSVSLFAASPHPEGVLCPPAPADASLVDTVKWYWGDEHHQPSQCGTGQSGRKPGAGREKETPSSDKHAHDQRAIDEKAATEVCRGKTPADGEEKRIFSRLATMMEWNEEQLQRVLHVGLQPGVRQVFPKPLDRQGRRLFRLQSTAQAANDMELLHHVNGLVIVFLAASHDARVKACRCVAAAERGSSRSENRGFSSLTDLLHFEFLPTVKGQQSRGKRKRKGVVLAPDTRIARLGVRTDALQRLVASTNELALEGNTLADARPGAEPCVRENFSAVAPATQREKDTAAFEYVDVRAGVSGLLLECNNDVEQNPLKIFSERDEGWLLLVQPTKKHQQLVTRSAAVAGSDEPQQLIDDVSFASLRADVLKASSTDRSIAATVAVASTRWTPCEARPPSAALPSPANPLLG
eukprot:GHVT01043906.1.p1 GENE.GHVT01043906.1~~GHVT01043906.1.p1  ORF type:complete len:464 (+),score=102.55 GHVT01043906.1:87-1394(+)